MLSRTLAAVASSALLASSAWAQGSYTDITPVGQFNQAIGISPSGEYVVGGGASNGFLWSEAGGLVTGFGAPVELWGVTDDGATLVGTAVNGSGMLEAARWTSGGGLSLLGNFGGAAGCDSFLSDLGGMSADGSTAVGMSWQGCQTSPMRWTEGVGLTLLAKQNPGASARCYAVSDDGAVAVGWDTGLAGGGSTSRRASMWTDDATQVFPTTTPSNPDGFGEITDVNSDGSVVCGAAGGSPFVWTASGGLQVLPNVAGEFGSHTANGMSEDGSVVVGVYFAGGFPPTPRAFIWTEDSGTVELSAYLTDAGITGFAPSNIANATGVSADGTRICGWGASGSWLVELADNPWTNLGQALAGVAGPPTLEGVGPLTAGSATQLDLGRAAPSALAGLFVGADPNTPAAFKGGTLVPVPFVKLLFANTTAGGTLPLSFSWPAGVPSGFNVYVQWAIHDAAAPAGVSLSNALQATTP